MKRSPLILLCLVSLVFTGAASAWAQDNGVPNLMGTWEGISRGAFIHAPEKAGDNPVHHKPGFFKTNMTLIIDKQKGHRFTGMIKSPRAQEPIVGVIADDNRHFYYVDNDGFVRGEIKSRNTVNLIYMHFGVHSKVATTADLIRQ